MAVLTLLVFFIISGCGNNESEKTAVAESEQPDYSEYENFVSDFEKVSVTQINEKLDNEEQFILYIGRKTCPYCRIFVPKLHKAVENEKVDMYYLDVEIEGDEIGEFLQSMEVEYVPSLISYNNRESKESLDINSETITVEEISKFLK